MNYDIEQRARELEEMIRDELAEPGLQISPAEREWWGRLAGNLRKARQAEPHIKMRD